MAVRQYIGARYVPRFSDVNGGVWSNVYTYDPLTIVKNGNDYYTSKKSVPVGVAISNTEYWVKTGDYNGAISSLDGRLTSAEGSITSLDGRLDTAEGSITSLDGRLDTAEGSITSLDGRLDTAEASITSLDNRMARTNTIKKALIIGDSYLTQGSGQIGTTMMSYLGIQASDYHINAYGSTGFAHSADGKNFLTLLQDCNGYFTNTDVSHIFFLGGANDSLNSISEISAAFSAVLSYCEATFPNAKIYVGFIGTTSDYTKIRSYAVACDAYVFFSNYYGGFNYLSGSEYIIRQSYATYMSSDGVHPTETGRIAIGKSLAKSFKNGTVSCAANIQTFANGFGNREVYSYMNNEVTMVWTNNRAEVNYSTPITLDYSDITIGTLSNLNVIGSYYEDMSCPVTLSVYSNAGANLDVVPASVILVNKTFKIRPVRILSISNVNTIIIPEFKIVMPTLLC